MYGIESWETGRVVTYQPLFSKLESTVLFLLGERKWAHLVVQLGRIFHIYISRQPSHTVNVLRASFYA